MRRNPILAAASALPAVAFANTHAGATFWVCATPQPVDLDAAGFAALTWVQVKAVGSHGETGPNTNILTYDTWDTSVVQKAKGITNAGDPQVELARLPDDPGQVILRAAALTNFNYAFKIEHNDKPNALAGSKPTTVYNRGLVTGPVRPRGRNEDFDLERFTLGLQQLEVVVDPVDATP